MDRREATITLLARGLSRRDLLKIAGFGSLALATGCRGNSETPALAVESVGIRRELGKWSQPEVEALARGMLAETQFNDITYAGGVLLDNQQGRPSFSRLSPTFTDDKVKFTTVEHVNPSGAGMGVPAGVRTIIREVTPLLDVSVRSRATGRQERISLPPALKLEEIQFNDELVRNHSDFLVKLYTAKEVWNVKAFDMVTSYIAANAFYTQFEVPQDVKTKNSIQASMMRSDFGEVPSSFMADLWAHYILVPNYLIAVEQGKFPQNEVEGNELRIFKLSAEVFQGEGVLTRNPEGIYEWTKDSNKFYGTWIDFSIAGFKALRQK